MSWRYHGLCPWGSIVGFVCVEKRLVIEVDGGQHAENLELDSKRSGYLKGKGYRILRFWNNEVLQEGEAVLNVILSSLVENVPSPPPSPPKKRGEGDIGDNKF